MQLKPLLLASFISLTSACGSDGTAPASDAGAVDAVTDTPAATDVPATDVPVADVPATDAPATDVPATDVPATDAPTADASAPVPFLNDCRASDYVDRSGEMDDRTVVPRGSTGYTPRCVIVRAGQTVTFSMDFRTHPLVAGVPHGSSVGATTPSVIMNQSSGTTYAVTFPAAGYFPFYCNVHGHVGMAGTVRVIP